MTALNDRPHTSGGGLVNAGVYLLDRGVVDDLSPACSLETDILPGSLRELRCAAR